MVGCRNFFLNNILLLSQRERYVRCVVPRTYYYTVYIYISFVDVTTYERLSVLLCLGDLRVRQRARNVRNVSIFYRTIIYILYYYYHNYYNIIVITLY